MAIDFVLTSLLTKKVLETRLRTDLAGRKRITASCKSFERSLDELNKATQKHFSQPKRVLFKKIRDSSFNLWIKKMLGKIIST